MTCKVIVLVSRKRVGFMERPELTAENYDDVIGQIRGAGLLVDAIETGRIVRCRVDGDRERRGWYCIHEIPGKSGGVLLVGSYGVWRGAEHGAQKISLKRNALTDEQSAALKARILEDRKRLATQQKITWAKAARKAAYAWRRHAAETGQCAYLERKAVAAYGLRFSARGNALVPMCDADGRINGLQILYGDQAIKAKKGRDKDFWPRGLAKTGHFHLIGSPTGVPILLVAEGYATAATLHAATGLPVAVAFDAGNLLPAARSLRKRYPRARMLFCADDDYLTAGNPGIQHAQAAALAVDGAWMAPVFAEDRGGRKLTDFNDLQHAEGLHTVRAQIEQRIDALNWRVSVSAARAGTNGGAGSDALATQISIEECIERYTLVYTGEGGVFFDGQERMLVKREAIQDILHEHGWRDVRRHPSWIGKGAVRLREVGFDPTESDEVIKCNLWGGWPTVLKKGRCDRLLDLLEYLCNHEGNGAELSRWVLRWLAYPIQHPGAKMKTALVFHGPQGVGKNLFFEAIADVYGEYARVIDQSAVEDKFNDWASKKLFMIADEVVARQELYHLKNKLKCYITGDRIRINPKNLAAHEERNHVNLVFLSNEHQPVPIEPDDRRFAVVWTPHKLDPALYADVKEEIDAGGALALGHFLQTLDLGDFKPWAQPPLTRAKKDLIELSMDNTERFWRDLDEGVLGITASPALSADMYRLYRWWCGREGERFVAANNRLSNTLVKLSGGEIRTDHILEGMVRKKPRVFIPAGAEPDPGDTRLKWLSRCVEDFAAKINGILE